MSTVWIYEKGDILTVFETEPEARLWLALNDPAGVVNEQNVGLLRPVGSADHHHRVPRADTRPKLRIVK
jgi:hypothetical protein